MRNMRVVVTLGSHMPAARICRANGWDVGTVLEGDEGGGPERIVITAVGEACILARSVPYGDEGPWNLFWRDWKRVDWQRPAVERKEQP